MAAAAMASPQALQGIGQLLQSFGIGNNAAEWNQNALVTLWNRAQQGDEMARQMFAMFADPARDGALDVEGGLRRPTIDLAQPLMDANQGAFGNVQGLFDSYLNGGYTDGMAGVNQGVGGAAGRAGSLADLAQQVFAGGGWSQQSQDLFDTFGALMNGRGNNSQLALGDVGSNLLGQRGQTAYTQSMQDRATDAANTRGMSPELQDAIKIALSTLSTGGETAQNSEMFGTGMDVFGDAASKALADTLQSPETAANWAREEAGNNILGQMEALYRKANARGGGPGSQVFSGQTNQMLADFAPQAAQAVTDASRKAFSEQEGRVLQDKSIAAGLANPGASLASQSQSNSVDRMGQAYSAIPGTTNAATQFMSSLLGAGSNAGGLEVDRMNSGTQMSNALLQSMLGGGSQYNTALGNANQYALGAGSLSNNASANEGSLLNSIVQSMISGRNSGTNAGSAVLQGQQGLGANMNNMWGNIAGARQNAASPLTTLAGQALGYAGQNLNMMGAPFGSLQGANTQSGFDLGGLASSLGGLVGMIPSGSGNSGNSPNSTNVSNIWGWNR
jgi:hypothetical protein